MTKEFEHIKPGTPTWIAWPANQLVRGIFWFFELMEDPKRSIKLFIVAGWIFFMLLFVGLLSMVTKR